MTKEEKIKEEYFKIFDEESLTEKKERFDAIKSFIDSHGWLSGSLGGVDENLLDFSGHEQRPKSLQGIETNNGWIEMKNKPNELPCIPMELYNILTKKHYVSTIATEYIPLYEYTHYKPLELSKPPIY